MGMQPLQRGSRDIRLPFCALGFAKFLRWKQDKHYYYSVSRYILGGYLTIKQFGIVTMHVYLEVALL